ncbi:MAG: ADP-ribosylglycohydrolase [Ruminococcaceae bacterium]|nr:ADP-ribosylglycohydrolase [Oscillospiraceae bacterium]
MIGAIFGDIVGSRYEFRNTKTKNFELFAKGCHFTDDSVMTLAVAKALLQYDKTQDLKVFQDILITSMHTYGNAYPYAGYGGNFSWWLIKKSRLPYQSFGNGSAMRVSPIGWYANSLEEVLSLAKVSAEVTHNHPDGIKGAVVTAGSVYLAKTGASKEKIKKFIESYYPLNFTLDEIRPSYTFDVSCSGSVPQAMQAFLESDSFEDTVRNAVSIGGDSDTIAAIAGSVAEAFYGMSEEQKATALSYLTEELKETVWEFDQKYK